MRIFLDDLRDPPSHAWTVCRTIRDFKQAVMSDRFQANPVAVSLDHDLGTRETGYDAACWLEEKVFMGYIPTPRIMLCHSANPVGKQRIHEVFRMIKEREKEND